MTALSISSRTPLCLNCLKRACGDDISRSLFPFHRQLRGKKKAVKRSTTINVKLLEDIPGYGRKGSITPVEPGRMRNTWYPRQRAEYVTAASLEGGKPQAVPAERDFTFGVKVKEEAPAAVPKEKPKEVQTKLLLPQRASEILEALVPSQIIFYRTPIPEPEAPPPEPPVPRRRAANSAAADLDAASDPLPSPSKPSLITIFGSVSTADIADSIKVSLAETKEGARVVLGAEDITFSQDRGVEGDRLKALGDFQVEARIKGGDSVRKTVSVRSPQE